MNKQQIRDALIRHQLLLMRLVRTQAKNTKKVLNKVNLLITEALKQNNFTDLDNKINRVLATLPVASMKLLSDVAKYEAQFTSKLLKVDRVPENVIENTAKTVTISVNVAKQPETVPDTYKKFASAVKTRTLRTVSDGQLAAKSNDEIISAVREQYNGMFTVQNLALAGVAVIGVANATRGLVATNNGYNLEWSAILDNATCSYCEDQDGTVYSSWDENEIPAHANCRCTWIVIEKATD